MPCSLYAGLPGSGKSYSVLEFCIKLALVQGRDVVTNIPLVIDEITKLRPEAGKQLGKVHQYDIKEILEDRSFWSREYIAGSVIILDEVWELWPAGLQINRMEEADKILLAKHRHMVANGYSTELVLVTQHPSDLCNYVLTKVDFMYYSTKLEEIGLNNKFRVDQFRSAPTCLSPTKRLNERVFTYNKDTFKLYKSSTLSKSGAVGIEMKTDKRTNILMSNRRFALMAIFIVVVGGLSFTTLADKLPKYFSVTDNADEQTTEQVNKPRKDQHTVTSECGSPPSFAGEAIKV